MFLRAERGGERVKVGLILLESIILGSKSIKDDWK